MTLITLNRPQALNALNNQVLGELVAAMQAFDADASQGCAVLTGSEKAFAAGADIKEMQPQGFGEMYGDNYFAGWEMFTRTRKPVIAAVAGFALGGGCELAMMCDFILAADTAKFGQPEIKLGVAPGMGGSQRLTRAVGKAKAMEMCLTGRFMDAEEAERAGLVSRIIPAADLVDEAIKVAAAIAGMAPLAVMANKEMVNAAFETDAGAGRAVRAPPVPRPVRHRGPEGRHGRVRREAAGQVDGEVSIRLPRKQGPARQGDVSSWAPPPSQEHERIRREYMARVAFIGLGNMGGGMAANLAAKGHDVRAFDLSAEALDKAKAAGCLPVASAAEACDGAEAVVTMLPAGKHVEAVYTDSVFGAAPASAILIDCSTIDVATAKRVGEAALAKGLTMVDAPVSGGIAAANAGTLTFMVGGSAEALRPRASRSWPTWARR